MPQSQANIDATVTLSGVFAGKGFTTITGGEVTAEAMKDRPPGARFSAPVETLPDISNVIVTKQYDNAADGPMLSGTDAAVGSTGHAVAGIVRDNKGNRIGTRTYSPCKLVRNHPPEGDTNSPGNKAMWELEFEVGGVV